MTGAGPCGLTAALELARRGFPVRIIDQATGPTPLSKAMGVNPRSLEILEASGVTERLLAEGLPLRGLQVRYEDRPLAELTPNRLAHRFAFTLALPQSRTEALMAQALRALGVEVEWGVELTAVRLAGDRVEVDLTDADGLHAGAVFDYLYAADGADSRVREALGVGVSGYTHRRQWSTAEAEIDAWPFPEAMAVANLHRNGDMGLAVPIGAGRFRAVANTADALAQVPGLGAAQTVRRDSFHIPVRQADTYQKGAVFLGGDAAHVHSPFGARGMNLGIEDAAVFARRLADRTLGGYTAERHPVGHRWIVLSERLLAAAQSKNPILVPLRNIAIHAFGVLTVLQRPGRR